MSFELRKGDLMKWLGLAMKIYKETSDTYELVYGKIMYELKWLRIAEDYVSSNE
jgi:hypothetical protein